MAFDPSTAKPIGQFDPSTARPITPSASAPAKPATADVSELMTYDPIRMPTGYTGADPTTSADPMTAGQQVAEVGKFIGRTGLGGVEGAIAGVPGIFGDIESLGRAGLGYAGLDVDPESVLPTTERIANFAFGEAERPEEKGGRVLGSLLSPGLGLKALGAVGKIGKEALIGRTTKANQELASAAEKLGFKLEAPQVRAEGAKQGLGLSSSAREANQALANKLASKPTGVEAREITPEFVQSRKRAIGSEYDAIFAQPIKVDRSLAGQLGDMASYESAIDPAGSEIIRRSANNLLRRFTSAEAGAGVPISSVKVSGSELHDIRKAVSDVARNSSDGSTRFRASNLLEAIDGTIERNHRNLAPRLQTANRQYAATMTLEDMIEKGGASGGNISLQKLGDYVARNTYGFGSGTSRHPHAELGFLGRELKIPGMFELPGPGLGTTLRTTMTALPRTQAARRIQRNMPALGEKYPAKPGQTTAANLLGGANVIRQSLLEE